VCIGKLSFCAADRRSRRAGRRGYAHALNAGVVGQGAAITSFVVARVGRPTCPRPDFITVDGAVWFVGRALFVRRDTRILALGLIRARGDSPGPCFRVLHVCTRIPWSLYLKTGDRADQFSLVTLRTATAAPHTGSRSHDPCPLGGIGTRWESAGLASEESQPHAVDGGLRTRVQHEPEKPSARVYGGRKSRGPIPGRRRLEATQGVEAAASPVEENGRPNRIYC